MNQVVNLWFYSHIVHCLVETMKSSTVACDVSSRCKCHTSVVPMQVCLTSPGSRWSSYTVQSARMFTRPSRRDTTTQTARTSAPASHTCSSWCTQSTGRRDHQTSSSPGITTLIVTFVVFFSRVWEVDGLLDFLFLLFSHAGSIVCLHSSLSLTCYFSHTQNM